MASYICILRYFVSFSCILSASSESVCPLWHSVNTNIDNDQCVCCDSLKGVVKCEKGYVKIQDGHCMTWNNDTNSIEVSLCLQTHQPHYNVCGTYGSYRIPNNISSHELNSMVCGSYNRQGSHCSQCTDGCGPAIFTDSVSCASCSKRKYLWILNLSMQLTTVTLMYLIVIILQIKGASSPLNVIITYSQLFINGLKYGSGLHRRLLCFIGKDLTKFIIAIFGIWNLDFFHVYIPPLCVSQSLTTISILLFDYIIALYPFLLTGIVLICVKLHDKNFKIIVVLSFPLRKLFKSLNWNPRKSILSTFVTFFLLVYSRFLYVSINFLFVTKSYNCNGSTGPAVLLYDPSIRFLHSEHIPYAIFVFSVIVIFVLLPPLLLLVYPTRLFRKCLRCCGFQRWDILHPIMDVFQGWYKDGTQGTRDYRSLSALYMLIRIGFVSMVFTLHLMDIKDDGLMEWIGPGITHICLAMFFFIVKPYKKDWMNHADGVILVLCGCLTLAQNYYYKIVYIFKLIIYFTMTPIALVMFLLIYKCIVAWRRKTSTTEE